MKNSGWKTVNEKIKTYYEDGLIPVKSLSDKKRRN